MKSLQIAIPLVAAGLVVASLSFVSAAIAQEAKPPREGETGGSFVDNFDGLDLKRWYISDGWSNGDHQNCIWSKRNLKASNGELEMVFDQRLIKDREYACAELQTRKTFGYGTYEARVQSAQGSGLNSAFFTFIGPRDKKPHDEIDFEVLGKNLNEVQVNQYVSAKGGNEKMADVPGGAQTKFNDYAFVWQKDRLRFYVNGALVNDVTDPAKLPQNPQKIFFSLWGTEKLNDWMGRFHYDGPQTMRVDRVAFTAEGDKCQFPESVACKLN
ncbi:endo-1,3-1,4-beta-glycanase ExoK [Allorhizobium undicola]|uniref:endo-1,3-1,4-beta-glycanase ExoK n=1 Tax=Allorhizobium undicola TaxID=78527 RepID=UPI00055CEC69|nr:family 16 glycosylhydrolase [Allorhizobium undicola]